MHCLIFNLLLFLTDLRRDMFRKLFVFLSILAFAFAAVPAAPAAAAPNLPTNCHVVASDLKNAPPYYLYCTPTNPNGDAVIYAHGYVPPIPDLTAAWSQLVTPDGTSIPDLITNLGFLFVAPTYSKNGLAVKEGLADTLALGQSLKNGNPALGLPPANHVFLVGASEGGLIATLAMETQNTPFSSAVAACGPIGDFRKQIDYFGDFRVLFDYFFNGVLPGDPVNVPVGLTGDWLKGVLAGNPVSSVYQTAVFNALAANPAAASQLIATSRAAIDPKNPATVAATALSVLQYSVVATMEAQLELGIQPYTNTRTLYFGSRNDRLLNRGVGRYPLGGSEAALAAALAPYQTTGRLQAPLVTIHTLSDPEDPYWHEPLYLAKVWKQNKLKLLTSIPIAAYGHCNFTAPELLFSFALAYAKGTHQTLPLSGISSVLPAASVQKFQNLASQYGEAAR